MHKSTVIPITQNSEILSMNQCIFIKWCDLGHQNSTVIQYVESSNLELDDRLENACKLQLDFDSYILDFIWKSENIDYKQDKVLIYTAKYSYILKLDLCYDDWTKGNMLLGFQVEDKLENIPIPDNDFVVYLNPYPLLNQHECILVRRFQDLINTDWFMSVKISATEIINSIENYLSGKDLTATDYTNIQKAIRTACVVDNEGDFILTNDAYYHIKPISDDAHHYQNNPHEYVSRFSIKKYDDISQHQKSFAIA